MKSGKENEEILEMNAIRSCLTEEGEKLWSRFSFGNECTDVCVKRTQPKSHCAGGICGWVKSHSGGSGGGCDSGRRAERTEIWLRSGVLERRQSSGEMERMMLWTGAKNQPSERAKKFSRANVFRNQKSEESKENDRGRERVLRRSREN